MQLWRKELGSKHVLSVWSWECNELAHLILNRGFAARPAVSIMTELGVRGFVKDGERGVSGFGGGETVWVGGTKHRMDLCRWVLWAVGVSMEGAEGGSGMPELFTGITGRNACERKVLALTTWGCGVVLHIWMRRVWGATYGKVSSMCKCHYRAWCCWMWQSSLGYNDNQLVVYVGVLLWLPGACLNRVCVYWQWQSSLGCGGNLMVV